MRDDEHKVQKAIAQYLDMIGAMYFAIPNGGNRNVITASKLKSEGVKKGVPDLCILKDGQAHFLEIKKPKTDTPKGYLSKEQKVMIERINEAGCDVAVIHSVGELVEMLNKWGFKWARK